MEVVNYAVDRINIDWLAEKQDVRPKSKLDGYFLYVSEPTGFYTEVLRSWVHPFSIWLFSPYVELF